MYRLRAMFSCLYRPPPTCAPSTCAFTRNVIRGLLSAFTVALPPPTAFPYSKFFRKGFYIEHLLTCSRLNAYFSLVSHPIFVLT